MRRLSSASRDGRLGDLDALLGCLQAGVGAPHLKPDGRIGALLIEFGALHQMSGFGDASLVRRSVEQIPAERDGGQPVGAAAIDKTLAVRFEGAPEADLRQHGAARAVGLGLRQAGGQVRLARFGALGGSGTSPGHPAPDREGSSASSGVVSA